MRADGSILEGAKLTLNRIATGQQGVASCFIGDVWSTITSVTSKRVQRHVCQQLMIQSSC